MGTPLSCHRSIAIVADGRFEVCDGAHRMFVMERKSKARPSLRDRTGHPSNQHCEYSGCARM